MNKRLVSIFLVAVLMLMPLASFGVSAIEGKEAVSPGLFVIAEKNSMAKAGIRGKEISFKREDFARALDLRSVSSVTFTSVPPTEEGTLTVGSTVIRSGQTVSGSNLSLVKFNSGSDTLTKSTFSFCPEGEAYEIECVIHVLDGINYAPSVSLATSASLEVGTYENVSCYGRLSAYDPDGDACRFDIVSYPTSGVLRMNDKSTGEYVYYPNDGFVGKDSFVYVVRDVYGNYSPSAEVSISVERSSISTGFVDMDGERAHAAALKLAEEGIMSGKQVGDGYYFEPQRSVSRAEFVSLAMQAIGIRQVNSLRATDFADDADIPSAYKGYVTAAYELDYVLGSYVDGKLCFLPNDSITRAEAAVIVGRMLSAATPTMTPALADADNIPAWAESSVYSLCSMGVLDTVDGEVRAKDVMSRADTALLLSAMMKVAK